MSKLKGSIVQVEMLLPKDKDRMWQLMDLNYLNVTPSKFLSDLSEKRDVILLRDSETEIICGFSTLMILSFELQGQQIEAVFSGDTIIDPAYWGEQELVRQIGCYFIDLISRFPESRCYWFLISKGYKTYRYLPLYFDVFFPRYDQITPQFEQAVLDKLAGDKFGSVYEKEKGILQFNENAECLRPGVADITMERLKNPHVQFFAQKNPGYDRGEELVCIAELSERGLKKTFFRVVGRQLPENEQGGFNENKALDSPFYMADLVR